MKIKPIMTGKSMYQLRFLSLFFAINMLSLPIISRSEHVSPTRAYIATRILPLAALVGAIAAGLYTIAVFTKSQIFSPATRLLLTPIGAGAAYGAACVPYMLCATLANYLQKKPADQQFLLNTVTTGRSGAYILKKVLIVTGIAGAGICVAALCGNKQASDLLDWANRVQITISTT
jgi:hypothetical protein